MQTSTQAQPDAAPAAPAAPQAPPAPPVTITIPGADGTTQTITVPTTRDEIQTLRGRRNELSDQLGNVTARRANLSRSIEAAPAGASRAGLEERIRLLDQRIIELETDLAVIGRRLSAAPPELLSSAGGENQGGDEFIEGMVTGGFMTLLLIPLALVYARRRWRRGAAKRSGPAPAASPDRFERLEQGIEAIAIEVERVSEGQRFVTKLLSESQTPLGVSHRIPQPVAAQIQEPPTRP